MSIIRTAKRENPFVQLDKYFLSDDQLTFEAKGILAYVLSKPDTWTIRKQDMIKRSKSGKTRIESAMLELMSSGYLNWYRLREEDGKFGEWVYDVYERPEFNPEAEKFILEGKKRLEERKKRVKSRNTKKINVAESVETPILELPTEMGETSPKVDNQLLDAPKVDNPPVDNPPVDNQPYSNNDFKDIELRDIESKREEEEAYKLVVTSFDKNISTSNQTVKDELKRWTSLLPLEIILNEIIYAAKHNAKSFSYLEKSFVQDLNLQIDSIEKLEQKRNDHTNKKAPNPVKNSFKSNKKEVVPDWYLKQQEERNEKTQTMAAENNTNLVDLDEERKNLLKELGVS